MSMNASTNPIFLRNSIIGLDHVKLHDYITPNVRFLDLMDDILLNVSTFDKPRLFSRNQGRKDGTSLELIHFEMILLVKLLKLIGLNSVSLVVLDTLGRRTIQE